MAALQEKTRVGLEEALARRLTEIQSHRETNLAELAGWDAELARRRTTAEIARDRLRSAIAEIRADPGKLKLSVGTDATIQAQAGAEHLSAAGRRRERGEDRPSAEPVFPQSMFVVVTGTRCGFLGVLGDLVR